MAGKPAGLPKPGGAKMRPIEKTVVGPKGGIQIIPSI
jgi:hypothetical protein